MDERKILFFDIDGTLITDDGKRILPEDTKEALRLARQNGHLLFINSGRVKCNIEDFILECGFDGLVCGCGTYISYGDQVLLHNHLDNAFCREVAERCRQYRFSAIFEHTDHTGYDVDLGMQGRNEILDYFKGMGRKLISDVESPEFVFDKFAAWYDEQSDVDGFQRYISPYFDYIDRGNQFCEIVPKGFSKASGIQFLLDYFRIPLHNAYVFGDSNNDIQMMQYVEHSIGMGQSSQAVKEIASYITDDVMEGGIYNAMKHFNLI
jgi:hypothetical protein